MEAKDEHWIRRCQPLALVADTAPARRAERIREGRPGGPSRTDRQRDPEP
ncbi:hypothetical protein LT493_15875 [Streptomyces tricolor]|nr:hypothetical protein [Streptomyces tricolor]